MEQALRVGLFLLFLVAFSPHGLTFVSMKLKLFCMQNAYCIAALGGDRDISSKSFSIRDEIFCD